MEYLSQEKYSERSLKIMRINQKLGKRIDDYKNGNEQYKKDNYDSFIIARNRLVKINMPVIWPIIKMNLNKGLTVPELKAIAEEKLCECAGEYNPKLSNFYWFARLCIQREFKYRFSKPEQKFVRLYKEEDGEIISLPIEDKIHGPLESAILNEIPELLGSLETREADVIRKRYGVGKSKEHSLKEIASIYGISIERVRQIETRALERLRRKFEPDSDGLSYANKGGSNN